MMKATLLLAVASWIIPRLHRRSAAQRHLLWAACLGTAALLPVLSVLLPSWHPDWARRMFAVLPDSFDATRTWTTGSSVDVVVRATGIEAASWTLERLLALFWVTGLLVALLRIVAEAIALMRLVSTATPIDDPRVFGIARDISRALHVRQPLRLLESARGLIPVTWGTLRPSVMLPSSAAAWSTDRVQAVLAHELAHVRRGDWVVHLLAEVACAVYWFHPLFWFATSKLRRESEHAADDVVLGLGVEGDEYANHLLEIVRAAQAPVRVWSPTVAMARPSHLEGRIAALLNAYLNRRAASRWTVAAVTLVTIAIAVPLASLGSVQGIGIKIKIRTADLPAIADAAGGASSLGHAAAPVRSVRPVGIGDTADAVTRPEVAEYTTPPLYSDEARRRGIEGIVTVGARVEVDGSVRATRLVQGLGFGLDQNALVALRQWRFRPGTRNGHPIAMDTEIDIEFSLRNEAVNELIANDMATRVGPGVTPPQAVRVFGLWKRHYAKHGTVVLDVVLLEDGTPKVVRILQSLDPELDEDAINNFARWRFSPAMKNGQPVKIRMNAEVNFRG